MQVSEKHKKLGNPVTETAVTETAVTVCARKQAETQERGRERERRSCHASPARAAESQTSNMDQYGGYRVNRM